jgi:hypothetical protein
MNSKIGQNQKIMMINRFFQYKGILVNNVKIKSMKHAALDDLIKEHNIPIEELWESYLNKKLTK